MSKVETQKSSAASPAQQMPDAGSLEGSGLSNAQVPTSASSAADANVAPPPPSPGRRPSRPSRLIRVFKAIIFVFYELGMCIIEGLRHPILVLYLLVDLFWKEVEFWSYYGIGPLALPLEMLFGYCNSRLPVEVTAQENRSLWMLFKISGLILLSFLGLNYCFLERGVFFMLIFMGSKQYTGSFGFMVGTVSFNDYMAKYITILIKTLFAALPDCVIEYRQRDELFHFLEITSQLYRSLLPIPLWIIYCFNWVAWYNPEWWLNDVLGCLAVGIYLFFKVKNGVWKVALEWKEAMDLVFENNGTENGKLFQEAPSEGLTEESCPICYDNFVKPIILECKHPFCEKCLKTWFQRSRQREPKCPVCQAVVKFATKLKYWDGSTLAFKISI